MQPCYTDCFTSGRFESVANQSRHICKQTTSHQHTPGRHDIANFLGANEEAHNSCRPYRVAYRSTIAENKPVGFLLFFFLLPGTNP